MKKIYRYFKFYIKTAFRNITRHLGLTFSASIAVSITLLLISLFSLISVNVSNVTYTIEDQVIIRASIDTIVKEDKIGILQSKIEAIEHVKNVTFSSGSEELESYKSEYADDGNTLFSMYDGSASPVRDAFIIEVDSPQKMESITKQIRKLDGIVSAEYGGASTQNLMDGVEMLREGSAIFILFLLLVAIFLISNKIKMSIYTRKNEIAIMRFVGSSNWSVKFPMMLEGITIGFLGAILPSIMTMVGYHYLYEATQGSLISSMLKLTPVFPLTLYLSLLMVLIGVAVGLFGGFVSTTRYLRWKR